eukprot:gene11506-12881_t
MFYDVVTGSPEEIKNRLSQCGLTQESIVKVNRLIIENKIDPSKWHLLTNDDLKVALQDSIEAHVQVTTNTAVNEGGDEREPKRRKEATDTYEHFKSAALQEADQLLCDDESFTFPVESGASYKQGHNKVFVRPVARHVVSIFKHVTSPPINRKGIMLVGPPGSGKSWCAQFFIWTFLNEGVSVIYENVLNKEVWVYGPGGISRACPYPANGDIPEMKVRANVYIHDTKAGGQGEDPCGSAVARLILVSSANSTSAKQSARSLTRLVYTTPSLHELLRAAEILGKPEVDVRRLYNRFGGSMRLMFDTPETEAEDFIDRCASTLQVDNLVSVVTGNVPAHITTGVGPTALFSTFLTREAELDVFNMTEDEDGNYREPTDGTELDRLRDAYMKKVEWRISTDEVFEMMKVKAGDHIQEWNQRFIALAATNPVIGVSRGNCFQICAPTVLSKGGIFKTRKLPNGKDVCEDFHLPVTVKKNVSCNSVAQVLRDCINEDTLYSICGSLPAFDLYKPPNVFVQVVSRIRPKHNINFEAAVLINAHCVAKGLDAIFLFAVPSNTFDIWLRCQSFDIKIAGKMAQRSFDNLPSNVERAKVSRIVQRAISVDVDAWETGASDRAVRAEKETREAARAQLEAERAMREELAVVAPAAGAV